MEGLPVLTDGLDKEEAAGGGSGPQSVNVYDKQRGSERCFREREIVEEHRFIEEDIEEVIGLEMSGFGSWRDY